MAQEKTATSNDAAEQTPPQGEQQFNGQPSTEEPTPASDPNNLSVEPGPPQDDPNAEVLTPPKRRRGRTKPAATDINNPADHPDSDASQEEEKDAPDAENGLSFPTTAIAATVFAMWDGGKTMRTKRVSDGKDRILATRGPKSLSIVYTRNHSARQGAEARLSQVRDAYGYASNDLTQHDRDRKRLLTEIEDAKNASNDPSLSVGEKSAFGNSVKSLEADLKKHDDEKERLSEAKKAAKAELDKAEAAIKSTETERFEYPLEMPKGTVTIG